MKGNHIMQKLPVRKEVLAFVDASEYLLSPAMISPDLTPEECQVIAEYVMTLSKNNNPWSKLLSHQYA